MPTPLSPKELLRRRRAYRRTMLARAGVMRSARQVPYGSRTRPGDFEWMALPHHKPDAPILLALTRSVEVGVSYVITYEPISGWWLIIEADRFPGQEEWAAMDVFDQLWACSGMVGPSREDAISNVLMSHDYLAPWIGTPAQAGVAKRRFRDMGEHWLNLFTDKSNLDTRECPGCDACIAVDGARAFHRVRDETE